MPLRVDPEVARPGGFVGLVREALLERERLNKKAEEEGDGHVDADQAPGHKAG